MARIAGVELQDSWKVDYALTHIDGIGWSRSRHILNDLKLDRKARVSDLSTEEISKIAARLEDFVIEGELARRVKENIQRLRVIGSYRGMRHARGLPVRGQRTKSNARQKRGKRKTIGAYKKEVLTKMTTTKKQEEKK
jgi:small subunit ribosomal protein S13